jgi:hypothetical protein
MNGLIDFIKKNPEMINALAAVCALFVSILSIFLTVRTLRLQRIHNFKSVSPIASLLAADYEGELEVAIRNTGIGPLIIKRFTVNYGEQKNDTIIGLMPELPDGIYWTTFSPNVEGRCIPPNQDITIFKLNGDPSDEAFASFRDKVRGVLSKLTVEVEYKDIYGRTMDLEKRDLKWFARNLVEQDSLTNIKDRS